MAEREETTRKQRDDAEGLARLIRHKCKHVDEGACFECLHDGLSQDLARKERIRAQFKVETGAKDDAEKAEETRKNVKIIRIGCAAIMAIIAGWWVFSSWLEASTYTKLTGKDVSTWDAMWVELRVQGGTQD